MKVAKLSRSIAWVAGAFLALSTLAGVLLAEATLHPGRRVLLAADEALARKIAAQNNSDLSDVSILATDNATLRAWNFEPLHGNGNAVVVFHGISDNRSGMLAYAEIFLKHGYEVLMPDARADGISEGTLVTFGLKEAEDTGRWLNWLQSRNSPNCIYGFAESMGAAGLLQSLQQEPFCAVAAESPFSSFREVAYDRVGQFFRTGPWLGRTVLRPVVDVAFIYSKWKYKLDFEQISPENSVAVAKVPILLIHGQADRNIPIRHSRRIAARNPSIVLWEVPGADHCGANGVAPAEFERRVITWFERNKDRYPGAGA